jgi:RNA polymerase sigma factor (sigma-70 family)
VDLKVVIKQLEPLIARIAKRIRRQWHSMDVEDLQQVGAIGLLKAPLHRYDPSKGPLENFAAPWIRYAMLRHLREDAEARRYERDATDAIADASDKPTVNRETITDEVRGIYEDLATHSLSRRRTPDDEVMMREMRACIAAFQADLSERDREFVRLRFVEDVSLTEAGLVLGRSRSWACRKQKELRAQLRRRMARGG